MPSWPWPGDAPSLREISLSLSRSQRGHVLVHMPSAHAPGLCMQEAISELEEIKHRAARSQQESARRDQISARHREVVETLRAEQVRLAAELASGAAREEALKEVARSNELRLQREISVLRQEVSRSAEREAAAGREAALATLDEGEVRLRARCEALLARQAELQGAAERERSEAASALERERAAREQSCADVTVISSPSSTSPPALPPLLGGVPLVR